MTDVSDILEPLNEEQRKAVTSTSRNILVLAGAGSGKTRVLTHRVAWLVRGMQVSPWSIMAVSFTNKSARVMRERIAGLLGDDAESVWAGTFHSIAYRLLNRHREQAGLSQDFQVLDNLDQRRLIKRVAEDLGFKEAQLPSRDAQGFINRAKDQCQRPADMGEAKDSYTRDRLRVYKAYEERRKSNNAVDFGELLLRSWELWRDDKELLERYRARFKHILVDEFQDTNYVQYQWLKTLVGEEIDVMAVGDDDQSIYGWRGAEVRNILDFDKEFADTETVRLERNYRSSGAILEAANAVIANNSDRLGKNLWTEKEKGELIHLYTAYNEGDEARFVVERAKQWAKQRGCSYADVGVLYRSNAQSRVLEEMLMRERVPYRIYGGQRFYERAEIKDALAWLSLLQSSEDSIAFTRAAATPRRGIGGTTLEKLNTIALKKGMTLWKATEMVVDDSKYTRTDALRKFLELIQRLRKETEGKSLPEIVTHMIDESGLLQHYETQKDGEVAQMRAENLKELVSACAEFEETIDEMRPPAPEGEDDAEPISPLRLFLSETALDAGERGGDDSAVQLMTIHSAKGLEFPLVFLTGMEDELFPGSRALHNPDPLQLEEERRLCYVGMTRAMRELHVSWARARRLYGQTIDSRRSRFLKEIPKSLLVDSEPQEAGNEAAGSQNGFSVGQQVHHAKFGEGVIVGLEGQGPHARARINFQKSGAKWLVLSYAKLRTV